MDLHMPGGGDWFSALFDDSDRAHQGPDDDVIHGVSADELTSALQAMRQGHIEFVTLVDGDEFAQAAGDGDGPYALEHCSEGTPTVAVPDAPFELVSSVLGKYLAGDGSWRQDLGAPVSAVAPSRRPSSEPERGGFFSRLRGK